jgi:hypothetical protein
MATVRPMSRPLGVGVLVALVVLVLAGCGGDSEADTAAPPATTDGAAPPPPADGGDDEAIRGSGGATPAQTAAEGEPVPVIVGPTLGGGSLSLSDYRGKKVIVHLWSSW